MNEFFKNDYFKSFQQFPFQGNQAFQMPQMDMNKIFSMQRKNVEAFAAATQALTEGTQAIARRGAEFVRDNMEDALNASRDLMAGASAPEKAAVRQTEYARNAVQNTVDQLREVSEMAAKSQFEAFDILSSRFSRSVEEAKDIAEKAKKAA